MIFIAFQKINLNYLLVHYIQNGNELMRKLIFILNLNSISILYRGVNLTHVVVLKPKQSGILNSTHAVVTYQKSEKNNDVQVIITNSFR
jgi:hypothetical protein